MVGLDSAGKVSRGLLRVGVSFGGGLGVVFLCLL